MGMDEAILNGYKMTGTSELGANLEKDMPKSEKFLALCENMTEEQLRGLAKLLTDRAEVVHRQKANAAWTKFVEAWKEYRELCPNDSNYVNTEVECQECEWYGYTEVDVFELLDNMVK